MELAIISPPSCLELSAIQDTFHMVLPEGMVLSPDYVRFYRDSQGYKVLDNGLVEGKQYTGVELHHLADQVGANCIVIPDQFRNADNTIWMARDFERHRNADLDYMGVLQGLDLGEFLSVLRFFEKQEWITHIGLPRILCEIHTTQRLSLVDLIKREQEKGNFRPFTIHALGGSPWIEEVMFLNEHGCNSMDTSLPVVMGLAERSLSQPYISRQEGFMFADVSRKSNKWRILVDNCRTYLEWAGYRLGSDS